MATANDYFITQRELCSIAGIVNAPEYLNNNYATKGIASSGTFLPYITLDDATNSYNSYQFLEKKYVSKKPIYFESGTIYFNITYTLQQELGLTSQSNNIRLFVQASSDIADDPNYFGYSFYPNLTVPGFQHGINGDLFTPNGSEIILRGESTKNYNQLFINGYNINITEKEIKKFTYKEPCFLLAVILDGYGSSSSPVAYCVAQGEISVYDKYCTFQNEGGVLKRINKVKNISTFAEIPVRMYYDTDGKYKCKFYDGSLGETVDYFI